MGDVLVLVRDCEAWQPHVRYAADLAAKLHCSINGIFVSPSAIPVPADASPAFAQEIIEIYREECERAQHAGPAFARWAAGQGIRHATWRIANGSPAEALEVARKFDLEPPPRVLITGSLYLAGDVLRQYGTFPQ